LSFFHLAAVAAGMMLGVLVLGGGGAWMWWSSREKADLTKAVGEYKASLTTAEERLKRIDAALSKLDGAGASTAGYQTTQTGGQTAIGECQNAVDKADDPSGSFGDLLENLDDDCATLDSWLNSTTSTERDINLDVAAAAAESSSGSNGSSGSSGSAYKSSSGGSSSGGSSSSGGVTPVKITYDKDDAIFTYSKTGISGCKYKDGPHFLGAGEVSVSNDVCVPGTYDPKRPTKCPKIEVSCSK